MNEMLQPQQVESPKEFCEQKRQKQNPSDNEANLPNKTAVMSGSVHDPRTRPQAEQHTRNFFVPLRTEMELKGSKEEANDIEQQGMTNQAGRPPPIILTSTVNLLQLQKEIEGIVKGRF
jgi:uncharacterized protein YgbK (DUF1537 family)